MVDLNGKYGRKVIRTNIKVPIGNSAEDIEVIKRILSQTLADHQINVREQNRLFNIALNHNDWWSKGKGQRADINNEIRVPTAFAITRTLNSYCFGEPAKYIAEDVENQKYVEKLAQFIKYQNLHWADYWGAFCSSVCGLGYKLVLPTTLEEQHDEGVPFKINNEIIYPQNAYIVRDSKAISSKVMGVLIGDDYNEKGEPIGKIYTVWTKYYQFVFRQSDLDLTGFEIALQETSRGELVESYYLEYKQIPLIEIERNALRKGDWEIAIDLMKAKNMLLSNRVDDVQQIVDYILVLTNCSFESTSDKEAVLRDRLLELKVLDPQNPPKVDIIKNNLDQSSVQVLSEYIDLLIELAVGIPNRQERGGGGGDTGQAVKFRNGFRDLVNNAGLILPSMEKSARETNSLLIAITRTSSLRKTIGDIKAVNVSVKYTPQLNDDIYNMSTAYSILVGAGMNERSAMITTGVVSDPDEVAQLNKAERENQGENLEINKTDRTLDD